MKSSEQIHNGTFEKAYAGLNPGQKNAVDAIEGPVMVIAGPGTGKTQMLALRIANILKKTDTPPSAILALTFTEAGVVSMRSRLVKLIGARGYQVRIHTFHGFCNGVIQKYPERFPRIIGGEQVLEIDAYHIIERIIDHGSFESLRPAHRPYLYVREIKGALSETKRENISPEELFTRIDDEESRIQNDPDLYHIKGAHKGKMRGVHTEALGRLKKAREFAQVYEAYEKELQSAHVYDFEDTILEVVHQMVHDEELRLMLQEEHQYLLADEHQDANGAQNKLLELLSDFHESPNLFIVGDEKQAIYRFQGASLENFLFFRHRYRDAIAIELSSNYRSTQVILDAAHDLIGQARGDDMIARPRLSAERGQGAPAVSIAVAKEEEQEIAHMGEEIQKHLANGVPAEEIAVLCRRNADVVHIASALRKQGIRVMSVSDEQVLKNRLVQSCIGLFRAIAYFGDDAVLYPLLYAPFLGLRNLDIYRLTSQREAGVSLWDILSSRERLEARGVEDTDACLRVFALLDKSATFAKKATLVDVIDFVIEKSGVLTYITGEEDMQELLEGVRAFLRYSTTLAVAHRDYGLRELLRVLDLGEQYGLSLMPSLFEIEGSVRVLTAHKAKGMEYDHVYIPFVFDSRWGARMSRTKIHLPLYTKVATPLESLDDERRLLYVAMTRARKSLTFSYAECGPDGRERVPSRFLEDISEEHMMRTDIPQNIQIHTEATARTAHTMEDEIAYTRARLATQGMSVSALNNYLESPWKYFFQNILRMPSRKETHQYYGSALDSVLKWLTYKERDGVSVSIEEVLHEFGRVMSAMPLAPVDYHALHDKGVKSLTGYIEYYHVRTMRAVDAGVMVSAPFSTGYEPLPEITLRGEFDRIEYIDTNTIRVVDFKTGSPKSRNVIEGKTKEGNGNYKRQLVFYALLASLDPVRSLEVTEGVIDFVEPDAKGGFHRETFPIDTKEVVELAEVVRKSIREICDGAFFDTLCDSEIWTKEGCNLVASFKRRIGR